MQADAIGLDDVVHPLNKAMVLVEALGETGVTAERALAGSGLRPEDLDNHAARMSTRQLLAICRNAVSLVDDPVFAMKAGRRVRASHLGVFGFALVSAETYREALHFVRTYRFLSAPLIERDFHQDEASGNGILTYRDYLNLDDALFRFVLEFQIGCTRTLVTDIFGESFRYIGARLAYPTDGYAAEREALLGAPIAYDSEANQLAFDGYWLDCPLPNRQKHTAATLHQMCEQMLSSLRPAQSVADRVAGLLVEQPGRFPGIEEIADRLHMTSRTLRRKLLAEGTCYAKLLASVRKELAIEYLRTTRMKTEAIAQSLGFSDVANFRQAFKKWTSMNPSEFRCRSKDTDGKGEGSIRAVLANASLQ